MTGADIEELHDSVEEEEGLDVMADTASVGKDGVAYERGVDLVLEEGAAAEEEYDVEEVDNDGNSHIHSDTVGAFGYCTSGDETADSDGILAVVVDNRDDRVVDKSVDTYVADTVAPLP